MISEQPHTTASLEPKGSMAGSHRGMRPITGHRAEAAGLKQTEGKQEKRNALGKEQQEENNNNRKIDEQCTPER